MRALLLTAFLFGGSLNLFSQVPGTLSYQGILMQSDGITPLTDGAHSLVFSFYTVSSGSSALFTRTISVTTSRGLYTCVIGGGTTPNAPFNSTEMNQIGSQQVYIGIKVDAGTELLPRAQLTTTAYTYQAQSAYSISDNAVTSLKIVDGTITNADINAGAAIVDTKLATISAAGKVSGGAITSGIIGGSTIINTTGAITGGAITSTNFYSSGSIHGALGTSIPQLYSGNQSIIGSPSPTSAEGAPGSETAIFIQRGATGGVKNGNTAEIKVSTWENGVNGRTSMEFWLSGLPNNENNFGSFGEIPVLVLHGDDISGTSNQGRVGIGTLAPSTTLSVNGDANKISGGTWGVFSDQRLKSNIRPFDDGLNVIMKIKPKYFKYNGLGSFKASERDEIGIIAQEVQPIAPYMITEINQKLRKEDKEDTSLLMYDGGSSLIYVMVNAIKEQQIQIEELKSANRNLEKRLASLEGNENKSVAKQLTASKTEKP